MRYSFFLILMITINSGVSAQWRPNPYYFYFKGLKADSSFILPRDTIPANVGLEPDSGRIAFKNGKLWLRTAIKWAEVGMGQIEVRSDKVIIPGRGEYGDPTNGSASVIDTTLKGWDFEISTAVVGYLWRGADWDTISGGGIQLLNPGYSFWNDGPWTPPTYFECSKWYIHFYPRRKPD